jgi:hypothetical protein
MEASESQAHVIKDVMYWFEQIMGKLINPSKCSLLFGSGCSDATKDSVAVVLKIQNITLE